MITESKSIRILVSEPISEVGLQELQAHFTVDYRPPVGIRISPHFYNTMDEIDRVMAEIASITATKDYAGGAGSTLVT